MKDKALQYKLRLSDARHISYMIKTFVYDQRKYHFVDFFIDKSCDKTFLVCKFYGHHTKRWHYEMFEQYHWCDMYLFGLIKNIKKNSKAPFYNPKFKVRDE